MVHRYFFTDLGSIVWIENDKRLKLDPSISFMICYTPRAESALQRIWESTTNPPPGQSVNLGYQWAISYFRCRLHERKLKIPNSNLFKKTQIIYLIPWQIKPFDIPSCKFSRIEPIILLSRTYICVLPICSRLQIESSQAHQCFAALLLVLIWIRCSVVKYSFANLIHSTSQQLATPKNLQQKQLMNDFSSFNYYYEHHSAGCIIAREMSLVSKPLALFLRLITEICHNFQSNKATCPDVSQFAIFSSLLLIFPPDPS